MSRTVDKKKSKPKKEQLCNNVFLDNKLQYEKNAGRSSKESEPSNHSLGLHHDSRDEGVGNAEEELINVEEIRKELDSVALDWKPLRNATECSCLLTLDQISKKVITLFYLFLQLVLYKQNSSLYCIL